MKQHRAVTSLAIIKPVLKWLMFPGTNLHARLRYRKLANFLVEFDDEGSATLDAGSGNGMLAYQSYLKGSKVLAVSIKDSEVDGCRKLFNEYLGISSERLSFEYGNLYELNQWTKRRFGQIICSETLEHIENDVEVCRSFWSLLEPGGVLHVCAPNADHPYNKQFPLDEDELGGHVRHGYTVETYRQLLEPLGFQIEQVVGLGGPIRQAFNRGIKETQGRFGAAAGLPLFLLALVALPFERRDVNPPVPFSIYVKARKPVEVV